MLLCRWHLEVTNYAIRKQKLFRKRDKPLRMGFCRKAPPIEDVFGSYKLEKKKKKKKGEQTPLPLSITGPRNYGRSHWNLVPRVLSYPLYGASEREREPGNEVEAGRCTFFPFITFDTRVNKGDEKKVPFFFTSTQPCQDQNIRIQECWFFLSSLLLM